MTTIKCVTVKIPLHIHKDLYYPEPTFYRQITALKGNKIQVVYIESIYWFEHGIHSVKQLKWLGDIKTKIIKYIPSAELSTTTPESTLSTASGKTFDLKRFSKVWNKIKTRKATKKETTIKLPALVPISLNGKIEYRMYTVLCKYAKRLHYEKLFQYEYLYNASTIYNKNSRDKILPNKLLKLTQKAFAFISNEIEEHPENFKQKLTKKELRNARIKNALILQANNKRIKNNNLKIIEEAIKTNKHYKAGAKTLNVSSLSNVTGLSRVTVTKLLKLL